MEYCLLVVKFSKSDMLRMKQHKPGAFRAIGGHMIRDTLVKVYDQTTSDSFKVMCSATSSWHSPGLNGGFGIGDTVAHMVQATTFFSKFVFQQVGDNGPFVLHPAFEPMALATGNKKHQMISEANLANARQLREKHTNPDELIQLYVEARGRAKRALTLVPEADYGKLVSHPLVRWEGTFPEMFVHLFIAHDVEHRGNITVMMREWGMKVPFHSGEIPDD